jgi:argininosuccinate lyase
MRDFKGMEQFFDLEYAARTDHRFQALGTPMDFAGWGRISGIVNRERGERMSKQPWWTLTDMVWVVCLHEADVIDREQASRLLAALDQLREESSGTSGEERLAPLLGGDMDLASVVNYGRTLQEPMSRLKLRTKMLELFEDTLGLAESLFALAEANTETIMVGYTHLNQGQPITLGHYLLAVIDGVFRGLDLMELAYRHTNLNSGGCGSCSGTTWPVDRERMAELLGMDGALEATYDAEASQDHSMTALYALTNLSILLSQAAMNFNIWAMDEIDMIRVNPSWAGVSSFMPQKCDTGSNFERTRVKAADVMGNMVRCMIQLKGEPFADMQSMFQLPERVLEGMSHYRECVGWFKSMVDNLLPQKERMEAIARSGYSCATELASHLITDHGYGGRLAHSIVATMVRQARVQGLKAYECTGEMLDEAAAFLKVRQPGLDTEAVRRCLDPEEFLKTHTNLGGACPTETRRLLALRRERLASTRERQEARRAKAEGGLAELERVAKEIREG